MRAARWHGRRDLRVDCIPVPEPGPGQALVTVEWCGICGTDLEEYRDGPVNLPVAAPHPLSGRTAPLALGHEIVGRIARAADGGPPKGTRVIPDVVVGCGTCWYCRRHQETLCPRQAVLGLHDDGGLAEYLVAAAATCVPVPEGLASDAAALAEPTAVAVRAASKLPRPLGSRVLVLGSGTIGLLVVQVCRAVGAARVVAVDPRPERRELARRLGADEALPPDRAHEATALVGEPGLDAVIECSGVPGAAREAIRQTRRGGTAVLVGFHPEPERFDLLDAVLAEKRIVGSAAHLWDEDVATAVDLLARGTVDPRPLIGARIPLHEVVERGFHALEGPAAPLKVLVSPML
jgi:2-desacetyl-2-hydroxyethyl bacteriochlorophyllide A dehydrogenase